MRRTAWALLLLFVFTLPWEYSADFGPPWGNASRLVGLLMLAVMALAALQAKRFRTQGALQHIALAFFIWFLASALWSVDEAESLHAAGGLFQQMFVLWLVWELVESPEDLRAMMRAYVMGAFVLALLTWATLGSPGAEEHVRFVPVGQDPNDVARYLVLAIPMAALLMNAETHWAERVLAGAYIPLAVFAVVLTASRGGFLALILVLVASGGLLAMRRRWRVAVAVCGSIVTEAITLWLIAPRETLGRLTTIPDQLLGGDLNQRWNIWAAGWRAFAHAPWLGSGLGTFVTAAGMAPEDTAHNTALAVAVEGGVVALALMAATVIMSVFLAIRLPHRARLGMMTILAAWLFLSAVSTLQGSRITWLLLGMISVAARLAEEDRDSLARCFAGTERGAPTRVAPSPA